MLRITIDDSAGEQRWVLQGRLVGPWVAELESTWKQSRSWRDGRKCVVDLSEVTLIDKRGEKILKIMRKAGAELIASGVYTKSIVDGIDSRYTRPRRRTP